jgi:FtsP/CotA-like multicopper oxidase with cupredoxin domain
MRRLTFAPAALAALAVFAALPASAGEYALVIEERVVNITGKPAKKITINGTIPGPALRFKEGEEVVVRVTNRLKESTSVHWHGLILPPEQDGVPGFNGFPGIKPGETFTYRFPIQQSGTYWYHAHSATQEQSGHYGPLIIEPARAPSAPADREHIVLLSEFTREDPERIIGNLKVDPGFYNYSKRTVPDFFRDARKFGFRAALRDRRAWGRMRMDPTDIADVADYTFLVNGKPAAANETLLFRPGERVKLKFINAAAMTYFDVRIPGMKMTIVAADGRDVEPVTVDEFRFAVSETYDVIVEPKAEQAFTVFAESVDRSGYARATLAPREGLTAPIPPMRPRALLTMAEMGHNMEGMDHGAMDHGSMDHSAMGHGAMDHSAHGATPAAKPVDHSKMSAEEHAAMGHGPAPAPAGGAVDHSRMSAADPAAMGHGPAPVTAAADHAGMSAADHAAMGHGPAPTALPKVDYGMGRAMDMAGMDHGGGGMDAAALAPEGEFDGSGRVFGWASGAPHGSRVLSYADLRSHAPQPDLRPAEREITVRLGGNMERYIWTLNGAKFGEASPIALRYGERVKLTFVNETMMAHPMHLHGMFMQLDNGQPVDRVPDKSVVSVAPGKTYSVLITADQAGEWAFHCHLLYHMESGMMQKVVVARLGEAAPAAPARKGKPDPHAGHGGRS